MRLERTGRELADQIGRRGVEASTRSALERVEPEHRQWKRKRRRMRWMGEAVREGWNGPSWQRKEAACWRDE
jgi:hypothetical protein